jgi:phosphoglycerate dehydrogenase-like enzyme
MINVLVSRPFFEKYGGQLQHLAESAGKKAAFINLPDEPGKQLPRDVCNRIDCTFMDHGLRLDDHLYQVYSDAVLASTSLKWMHLWASGVTHIPFVSQLASRGVLLTSSTGANAEPVAQTGFSGLLMLARGFPQYIQGQHKREWRPLRGELMPNDLRGQTVVIVGVGAIGRIFAAYARAFGLRVIGVRRSPMTPSDPVDEMYSTSRLKEVLPRADWLVLACPLTSQTRDLIDREMISCLKRGACLINIARGALVDEEALVDAIRSGQVGGAALDAHRQEPLPADSPLWDLPNVIITPKNAAASKGNEKRYADMFIKNFGHWIRGEPLFNVQHIE